MRTENKVLFCWDLGELLLCVIGLVVGLSVVPNAEVYPFDHSPEMFLAAVLAATVVVLGCLIVSPHLANGDLVTAVAFVICSVATIVAGFYELLGGPAASMSRIEARWASAELADATGRYEAAHDCCGASDFVPPKCHSNYSCHYDLKNQVTHLGRGVGTGLTTAGFMTLPQGFVSLAVWLWDRKHSRFGAAQSLAADVREPMAGGTVTPGVYI
jgi:hypothetical protein